MPTVFNANVYVQAHAQIQSTRLRHCKSVLFLGLSTHRCLSVDVFFSICLPLMVASLRQINPITNLLYGSADFSPVLHWIRVLTQFLGFLVSMAPMNKKSRASGM